jgi:hypothetical protein
VPIIFSRIFLEFGLKEWRIDWSFMVQEWASTGASSGPGRVCFWPLIVGLPDSAEEIPSFQIFDEIF